MPFTIKAKVWVWPGLGAWHFVYVDAKNVERVRKVGKKYGSGFVKVRAKVGKTEWETALFPHKKENAYLLSIKKSVRQKEGILDGDVVTIKVWLV